MQTNLQQQKGDQWLPGARTEGDKRGRRRGRTKGTQGNFLEGDG